MLGQLLKERRIDIKKSRQDIALEIGYDDQQFIYNIEKDKNTIPVSKLKLFANAYEIDFDQLKELVLNQKVELLKKRTNKITIIERAG